MESAWDHCAPGRGNYVQTGGRDLRIVFKGLRRKMGLGACGVEEAVISDRDWAGGWRRLGRLSVRILLAKLELV